MYYGRMWLVVKPTVGIPLFFGGVALTSLAVHSAVLTNTDWFPAFLNGKPRAAAVAAAPAGSATAAAPAGQGTAVAGDARSAAAAAAQSALASGQFGLGSIQVNLIPK